MASNLAETLEETCRCCLRIPDNGVLIMSEHLLFDGKDRTSGEVKIIDSYHELCVDPLLTNRGSFNICSCCRETLQKFVTFRVQCRENNEMYQNMCLQAEKTSSTDESTRQLLAEVLLKTELKSEPESDGDETVDEQTAVVNNNCAEPSISDNSQDRDTEALIESHISRASDKDGPLECLGCHTKYANNKNLRQHIARAVHNGIKTKNGTIKNTYNCLVCGQEFDAVTDMHAHLKAKHANERHFPCFYCKKSFASLTLYQQDFAKLCVKLKKDYIKRHGKEEPTIGCEWCTEKFHEEDQMMCHRISEHDQYNELDGKQKLWCEMCKMGFRNRNSYYLHMKEQHPKEYEKMDAMKPGGYTCTTCGKNYTRVQGLKLHIQNIHLGATKDVKCPKCPSAFRSERDLKMHLKLHNNIRQFECNECGQLFLQLKTLHNHLLYKHFRSECRFKCIICEKRFLSNCKLKRHMGLHNTAKNVQCQFCAVKCKTEKSLAIHVERQHNSRQVAHGHLFCKICSITFRLTKSLYEHTKQKHPEEYKTLEQKKAGRFVCTACGRAFDRGTTLRIHYSMVHCDVPRDIQCQKCTMAFKNHRALKIHLRLHDKEKTLECNECGQMFREFKTIKSHLFLKHFRSCCKFVCNVCEKRFYSNFELSRHTRQHTGVKNYKCEFCDVKYATDEGLKRHIQVRHTNLRYDCKLCDSRLKTKYEMWDHAWKHRDCLPFNCPECSKGFCEKYRLKTHLKSTHGIIYDEKVHGYHKETFDQVVASCVKIDESNAVHYRGKRAVSLMSDLKYLKKLAKEKSQQDEEDETME